MKTIDLIFAIICAAGTILGGVWIMLRHMLNKAEKRGADDNRLNTLEKRIDELPCEQHLEYISEIRSGFDFIRGALSTAPIDGKFAKRKSPFSLTKEGVDFIEMYKVNDRISEKWDYIESTITSKNLTSAYDINEFCYEWAIKYPEEFFTHEDLEDLKNIALGRGENLHMYSIIIFILVRDRYFGEKGINIKDIDKHVVS